MKNYFMIDNHTSSATVWGLILNVSAQFAMFTKRWQLDSSGGANFLLSRIVSLNASYKWKILVKIKSQIDTPSNSNVTWYVDTKPQGQNIRSNISHASIKCKECNKLMESKVILHLMLTNLYNSTVPLPNGFWRFIFRFGTGLLGLSWFLIVYGCFRTHFRSLTHVRLNSRIVKKGSNKQRFCKLESKPCKSSHIRRTRHASHD